MSVRECTWTERTEVYCSRNPDLSYEKFTLYMFLVSESVVECFLLSKGEGKERVQGQCCGKKKKKTTQKRFYARLEANAVLLIWPASKLLRQAELSPQRGPDGSNPFLAPLLSLTFSLSL